MSNEQSFFNLAWPYALQASKDCGIFPDIIFAQAALESGWGLHHPQNNYFGIKSPTGRKQLTTEVIDGHSVKEWQTFDGFTGIAECFHGYAVFIASNERYGPARAEKNIFMQLNAICNAGYATDPLYYTKVVAIVNAVPALLKSHNSIVAKTVRVFAPIAPPAIPVHPAEIALARANVPRAQPSKEPQMSDLSVDEKDVGSWLQAHLSALTGAANVLKTVTSAIPLPAAQAVSGVIAGLESLAGNVKTVAASVTTVTKPPVSTTIVNTVETDAFNAALAAEQAAFEDVTSGKPIATIEHDALVAAETSVFKGTSN